ncbi:MAG: TetR/AcrR family transcriptional regulator [Verrucomicrobia bacterium]|nr:TetR/AcrR family transcriptional regulator [Verrucomicrobiota bacterium]
MNLRKGSRTRQTIVDEALGLARRIGLEGVTLGELASSVQLSKSGLFAHFKSKEALQLAVLEEACDQFTRHVVAPALTKPRGRERLEALFENYGNWIANHMREGGCIFISLSQEYDDRPGVVRDRLVEAEQAFRDVIRRVASGAADLAGKADFDADQFVFGFMGIGLSLQQAHRLLREPGARDHARQAFRQLCALHGL